MRRTLTLLLPVLLVLAPCAASAQTAFSPEGKYELVDPPQPTETPGKIEIVDVFWYGCPHCFRFLPYMERYAKEKPSYVEIRHMPAIFNKTWEIHARAFYTAEILGIVDQVHHALFDEIHVKGNPLDTKQALADFFGRYGVDRKKFLDTFDSFAVDAKVRKSKVMQERYGVRGTPTTIVNGKYRTSGSIAGSYENVLKVVAYLVDKEHKAQLAKQ